jgi:hypothetical protein
MVQEPDLVDYVILSGTSARMSGGLYAILRLSLALNRSLLRLLSPGALATLVRWQTGIPRSLSPLIEDDMKRVDPDSLSRFILATYGDSFTPATRRSPVLVLVGEKETPVAKPAPSRVEGLMARRLKREITGAQGAIVRSLGHIWNSRRRSCLWRSSGGR